jgi:hypothetical protein
MIEVDELWSCTYEKKVDRSSLTIFHDTWTKTHVQNSFLIQWPFKIHKNCWRPNMDEMDDDGWTLSNMGEKKVGVSYYN